MCSAHANESTENIDEIVQDHDTFGTDENEEDSMDSLTMALMESRSSAESSTIASTSNSASYSMLNASAAANKIGGYKRKSGEEILESHAAGDGKNYHHHHHQNQIGFDPMNNEISPLNGPFKRKREAFSDQEQEVCLTPVFVSPESSMLLSLR